jgi:putative hydrolase of the HAD superfamily
VIAKPIYVRAVFFDAAGTLLHVRGSVGKIYWELAKPHGIQSTPDLIEKAFQDVFETSPPPAFPNLQPGLIRKTEKQWWRDVVSRVFHQVGGIERFDEYFEKVFEFFSSSRGWELYPETKQVLGALKDRGLVIGIVSNFDSRIYPVLSELGIFPLIDSVHLSTHEGSAKPDVAIFKKALEAHSLHPKEALHVGDSFKEDIQGALAAGLGAIYVNRQVSREPEYIPTISNLKDLLPLIQRL